MVEATPSVVSAARRTGTQTGGSAAPWTGLSLSSLIDPAVRYAPIHDDGGTIVDFRYVELNDAAVEYNHRSREDTIGRTLLEIFPGHVATGWLQRYAEVTETGVPLELNDVSYEMDGRPGDVRHFEIRAFPTEGGFVLTWRDVTTRISTQQLLAVSE